MSTSPTLSSSVPSPQFTSSPTFYSARQLPPHLANPRSHLLRLPSDALLPLSVPKQLLSFISSLSPPSASLDKVQLVASIIFRAGYDSFEAITELVAFERETREKVWEIVKLEMGEDPENYEVVDGIERRISEGGQNGWIG